MKILAIVGSPRTKENMNFLVDRALEEAELLRVETEKVMLSEWFPFSGYEHDDVPEIEVYLRIKVTYQQAERMLYFAK